MHAIVFVDTKASTENACKSLKHINKSSIYMSKFDERFSRIKALNDKIRPMPPQLTPFGWHEEYRKEAIECFHQHLPLSCIVVSSALVETCLCWEHFRRKPIEERKVIRIDEFKWLRLNSLFKEFIDSDIPLELLMDTTELIMDAEALKHDEPQFITIEKLRKMAKNLKEARGKKKKEEAERALRHMIGSIKYVVTRNKFAHGDLFYPKLSFLKLLPFNTQKLKDYGIDNQESLHPNEETVAYVHLSKTLAFMKAFTDLIIRKYNLKT